MKISRNRKPRGVALVIVLVMVALIMTLLAQNHDTLLGLGNDLRELDAQQQERLTGSAD